MAILDGTPATDFSAMNREWVRAVAKEEAAAGGDGIPAPENPSNGDVLTYDSTAEEWVAAAPGGGGGGSLGILITLVPDDPNENLVMDKTWNEIKSAIENNCFVYAYFKDVSENMTEWIISYPRDLSSETGSYLVIMNDDEQYEASSADGYPVTDYGGGG